ncbi:21436_t:CDS:2, partial [Entrophospora sp. SA101]
ISVNKKKQKWQKKCDKFSLKPLPPIIKNLGNESNLKEISSSLGGPIHNLITAITIFKNNPQMNEITKRFLEDGYDDLEESLKPWILDL